MREKQRKIRGNCGITLIALIITMTVPYYETLKASKIGKVPPENKIEIMRQLLENSVNYQLTSYSIGSLQAIIKSNRFNFDKGIKYL